MPFLTDSISFISGLSTDTLLLIFIAAALGVAGLYLGKDWIVAFIASLFIGRGLFAIFPYDFGQGDSALYAFLGIIVFSLALAYVLKRFITADFPYKNSKKYLQAVILGITGTIALLANGLLTVYTFSPFISRWFEGNYLFWTSVIPFLIFLFIIRR